MQTANEHTIDTSWYDAIAADIRSNQSADDEGTLWVLFVEEDRRFAIGMAVGPEVDAGPDEYDGLTQIIDEIDPPGVVLAVTRDDGVPRAQDWRLWEQMRARLAAGRAALIDVIVVGHHSWWAAVAAAP
jgi:hypothetical protein